MLTELLGAAVSAGGTVAIALANPNPGFIPSSSNVIATVPPADTAAPNNFVST